MATSRSNQAIFGTLYQEWQAQLTTYDEDKTQHVNEGTTSEQQLFFFDLVTGLAGLQTRNFRRETGLGLPLSRERFLNRVIGILASTGFPGCYGEILRGEQVIPKDRVWSLMTTQRVTELQVSGVSGSSLDPAKPVFNPDNDPNTFYAERIWPYSSQHVESVGFKAADNGSLGQVKEARAYAAAGETQRIVYTGDDGTPRTEQVWNGRLEAQVTDSLGPAQIDELILEIRGRIPDNVPTTLGVVPLAGTQGVLPEDGQ